MVQLLLCVAFLLPLVGLPVIAFTVSAMLGIIAAVLAAVLAVPLVLSGWAHFDLMRVKSRYGLSENELAAFARLVPRLALAPTSGGASPRQRKRAAKQAALTMIQQGRRQRAVCAPEEPGDRKLAAHRDHKR